MCAEDAAEFAPGDPFIEEGFRGRDHVPPVFATAVCAERKFSQIPFIAANECDEDFVYGDVAKMQEGREAAGNLIFWFVKLLAIGVEIFF
jgi:hypothetical protein